MHQDRVIDVGSADVAFSGGYYKMKRDNGTYTAEEGQEAKQRIEELRKPYLEQLVAKETKRLNKK